MDKQWIDLDSLLDSIDNWIKVNHPDYLKLLAGPASDADLDLLCMQAQKNLPVQFVKLYKHHDGMVEGMDDIEDADAFFHQLFGNWFMPLAGVDGVRTEFEGFEDDDCSNGEADGPVKPMYYNQLWVPFAKDFSGNYVGIDLDPPSEGTLGQVIRFGRDEEPTVLAPSLAEYFAMKCAELKIPFENSSKKDTISVPSKPSLEKETKTQAPSLEKESQRQVQAPPLEDLIERLKADKANFFGDCTPEKEFSRLENELHFRLPKSLATFLKHFNGGAFFFGRVYCVSEFSAGRFEFRKACHEFFKNAPLLGLRSLVPFATSDEGDIYCFDLSTDKIDPPILVFDKKLREDQELRRQADSLASWIANSYQSAEDEFAQAPRFEVFMASEATLDDLPNLSTAESRDLRYEFKIDRLGNDTANIYSVSFPAPLRLANQSEQRQHLRVLHTTNPNSKNLQMLTDLTLRAIKQKDRAVYLFVSCLGEMSKLPEYKKVIGKITIGDKEHELIAGDMLKVEPGSYPNTQGRTKLSELQRELRENHISWLPLRS